MDCLIEPWEPYIYKVYGNQLIKIKKWRRLNLDRILVTPRSFGSGNSKPKKILERQNYKITYNNTGKHFTEKQMIKKLADKDAVIVGTDPISAKVIENASQLRVISKYGVGLDNIDLEAANKNGIMVTYTPGTNF